MQVKPVKTNIILPHDSLSGLLDQYLPNIQENTILAVSSKIISLCQGQIIKKSQVLKENLIKQEADRIFTTDHNPYGIILTIKNNILIPSAGIDESNSNDCYIIYPKDIRASSIYIWQYLRKKHNIKNLGIIITDSRSTIMRKGVTGIAIGWCGFKPLYSYIGKPDIFGKQLKISMINLLDALASSAVLVMGEGDERTPMAIIINAPKINFVDRVPSSQEERDITIALEDDIYAPIIKYELLS